MTRLTSRCLLVIVVLVQVACSPTPAPATQAPTPAAPTPVGAVREPPPSPSPSPTPAPSETVTPRPSPTRTAAPTMTPAWPPTPTATLTPSRPTPTPDWRAMGACKVDTITVASPDGRWVAETVDALPTVGGACKMTYHTRLTVTRSDGQAAWTAVDEWRNWGLGWTSPRVLQWSRNGRHLYLTNLGIPDGCPGFVNGTDLLRVDLQDGTVTEVAPPLGLWLALSPDEGRLAAGWLRRLTLRDLATGQDRELALASPEADARVGKIVWSPDGSALMVTMTNAPCSLRTTHAILRVDAATLAAKALVDANGRLFTTEAWPEPGRVLLADKDKARWWMDAATGALTRAE